MDDGIGWIASIIIGGIAGWLAEMVTRSNMGIITNIILGIIGAAFATWLFGVLGVRPARESVYDLSLAEGLTELPIAFADIYDVLDRIDRKLWGPAVTGQQQTTLQQNR